MNCPCPKHPFGCYGHPNLCGCEKAKVEAATALEAKDAEIAALKTDLHIVEGDFTDVCDELGCKYDNEAALEAVATLRRERDEARAALKPFCRVCGYDLPDNTEVAVIVANQIDYTFTLGEFRAARAIMED